MKTKHINKWFISSIVLILSVTWLVMLLLKPDSPDIQSQRLAGLLNASGGPVDVYALFNQGAFEHRSSMREWLFTSLALIIALLSLLSLCIRITKKRIPIFVLLLCLQCGKGFGVVLSMVESPQDDLKVLGGCNFVCEHPELESLANEYNELLRIRFGPLKSANIAAIFGAKLDQKPGDQVKPLFVPMMIMESGLGYTDAANKRHIDFHAIGDIGYLEVHYQYDGESVATVVLYLRADAKFVPLKSTNDIPLREDWDNVRFELLKTWLNDRLPKLTDLGVVEVSPSHQSRIVLDPVTACILTTRDIHARTVPFWLSITLAKEIMDPKERQKSMQYKSVDKPNQPIAFVVDGKFYRLTPRLVDQIGW